MDKQARLEEIQTYIDEFTKHRDEAQAKLDGALKERRTLLEASRVLTADDYRIVICEDRDGDFLIDNICGDAPDEDDSDSVKSYYQRVEAILAGETDEDIHAYGVILQCKDVETGEFKEIDACWGFYYLTGDNWHAFYAMIVEYIQESVPKCATVRLKDIDVVSGDDI